MAEPRSLIASIIAVLELSSQIVSQAHKFVTAKKETKEAVAHLRNELRDLEGLLWAFQNLLSDSVSITSFHKLQLMEWSNWLQECHTLLEDFTRKLSYPLSKWKQLGNRLVWPLKERDMERLATVISQKKANITLGLAVNQINNLNSIREETSYLRERQDDHLRTRILEWLAPLNVESNFDAAREKHHAGTGVWFLSGRQLLEWRQDLRKPHLWLHGIPGCGKTILAGSIINELQVHFQSDTSVGLAYFFFSFADPEKQVVSSMLSTIIAQLCQQLPTIPDAVEAIHTKNPNKPTYKTLLALLEVLCSLYNRTYIVLDALDEVSTSERGMLLQTLRRLGISPFENFRILATSRREPFLQEGLKPLGMTEVSMNTAVVDGDIRLFVSETLVQEEKFQKWSTPLQSQIESTLVNGAHGMFRWVECQLDILRACRNANSVKKALASLPETLDETYSRILLGIPEDDVEFAKRTLVWLTFSARPMSVEEIAEAIVVQAGSQYMDNDDRFVEPREVLTLCGSLVTIIEDEDNLHRGHVKLAHYSVKEYLISNRLTVSPFSIAMRDATTYTAEICLTYLSFRDFYDALPDEDWELIRERKVSFPFLQYVSDHWGMHVASTSECEREHFETKAVELLGAESGIFNNWLSVFEPGRKLEYRHDGIYGKAEAIGTAVYYFALFGLQAAVRISIARGADVNCRGGEHVTPLAAAAYGGHKSIVQVLLESGADVNAQDAYGHAYTSYSGYCTTALQAAISQDHDEIARLLVENGADINAIGSQFKGTALRIAADMNNENMVRYLLDKGANVNAHTARGTVLAAEAGRGNTELVRLLLEHGAAVNVRPWDRGQLSAIAGAALAGSEVLKLLISHGAQLNAMNDIIGGKIDAHYCTALRAVSSSGWGIGRGLSQRQERGMELLRKYGADLGPDHDI